MFRNFWYSIVLLLAGPLSGAAAGPSVLLLHSYHAGYEWTDDITRGVRDGLPASELFLEYLDIRRAGSEWRPIIVPYLAQKYARLRPAAIIAADDYAVRFLIEYRDTLFPNVPVVFCGVNEHRGSSAYVRKGNLAGVLERINLEETVRTALSLHPSVRSIVTVGEADDASYDTDLAQAFPGITTRRLRTQQLTMDQLGAELQRLNSGTIVLLSAFSRDAAARQLTMAQSAEYVTSKSPVPVYGLNKNTLGHGIVGGALNDGYYQGRAAAEMTSAILAGARPEQLGVRERPAPVYQFDYRQIKRWKIPVATLPSGSQLINKRENILEKYRAIIWTSIAFIAAQTIALVALGYAVRRRRRAERAAQEREAQLRLISDNLPALIAYVDANGHYVRVNRAYEEWFERSAADIEGRHIREILGEQVWPRMQELVTRVLRGERVNFEVPINIRGRTRQLAGSYAPHIDKGIVQGFVVLGLDITERKNTEALLVLQAEALAWSNRELEEFVYLVSHDLHEPLRTIRGFAQLLESRHKAELGPDAVDYLNFITDGAQRMQQMIDGLLAYSRVSRAEKPASAPVDMNEVARAAIANLTAAIATEGARVQYDELPMVTGDASRLTQVLQNLIGNALKYRAAAPPYIHISAKSQEREWVFAVSDNGQGFEQKDAERIFGLFKRLHGRDIPGTGIGLTICHKIIERHHGRIWAESTPGSGATFYFTLSVSPTESQTPEQAQLTLA